MLSQMQREDTIRRRGYRCDRCGHIFRIWNLEIHHRNRDPYDNRPENLRVLCKDCHYEVHGRTPPDDR